MRLLECLELALGRNGDQTCGCLLTWRERVLISLVTKDFLRRDLAVGARTSEGRLSTPEAVIAPDQRS